MCMVQPAAVDWLRRAAEALRRLRPQLSTTPEPTHPPRDRLYRRGVGPHDGRFATSITTIDTLRISFGDSESSRASPSSWASRGRVPWGGG